MTLLRRVVEHLESRSVPSALIGGAALALHGIARATVDADLLVLDGAVVEPAFWKEIADAGQIQIRKGDSEDPLAGVVRWTEAGSAVDVVIGKDAWMGAVLGRREWRVLGGESIPVVHAADLILLKLAAGGPQDLLDACLLLAGGPAGLRAQVDERLAALPSPVRSTWMTLQV